MCKNINLSLGINKWNQSVFVDQFVHYNANHSTDFKWQTDFKNQLRVVKQSIWLC